jgi:GNAT superfamily N-acetyltransferase
MNLRIAKSTDVPALLELIDKSVRALSAGFYTGEQIDGALAEIFGVDSQLIADGTYYVIEDGTAIAAAGGWSARRTLFGGDQMKDEADPLLDPSVDAARIRAFYVSPDYARRGLGRQLYAACERSAQAAGFRRFELMATLPGVPLYKALGFEEVDRYTSLLRNGVEVPFIRMSRSI